MRCGLASTEKLIFDAFGLELRIGEFRAHQFKTEILKFMYSSRNEGILESGSRSLNGELPGASVGVDAVALGAILETRYRSKSNASIANARCEETNRRIMIRIARRMHELRASRS